jgi:hypothetical protein
MSTDESFVATFAYTDVAAELEESRNTLRAGVFLGIAGGAAVALVALLVRIARRLWTLPG